MAVSPVTGHHQAPTLGNMSTIELPDDVAAALAAAAAERGISVDELAAQALAERFGTPAETADAFAAFVGFMDSGDPDWAGTDTAVLRKAADARRSA
jgi:hypothetical protein